MRDCKGIELKVGDFVVFIKGYRVDVHLETGWIDKISVNRGICRVQDVPGHKIASGIKSEQVMKL